MCHLNQYFYLAIASTVFLSPKSLSHPPVLDIEYCRDNQIDITAPTRISILNLSTMDSDLKKMAKKAASLKLAASFLMNVVTTVICCKRSWRSRGRKMRRSHNRIQRSELRC